MRRVKEPNNDASQRFSLVPEAIVTDLRKVFPVRQITPASSPTDIYYEAGIQKVIDFLAETAAQQKEPNNVLRPEDS